jgi:hypothetical protein
VLLDERDGAVDVQRGLGMEADDARARLGEFRHQPVDRAHHQVHVERQLDMRPQRGAHHRADGEIRHVMVVHHVEVDQVGAGARHRLHFVAEAREVGRKDAGSYAKRHQRRSLQCSPWRRKNNTTSPSARRRNI